MENNSGIGNAPHAVIVRFDYGINALDPLFKLENVLEEEINKNEVGEYDGHEIAINYSDGILFMYGPDADLLFKTVLPVLKKTDFMKNAVATLRFGPPEDGVKQIEVNI